MIITENQLDEWVRENARDAQGVIVELVWRLVAASCPKPKDKRFPLGDSIGQHGPDGMLEVDFLFGQFVPKGRSFWEIGTGVNARGKATEDYHNLTSNIPETVRLNSTFIFVTPLSGRRDWEYSWKDDAQGAWLEERRRRSEWQVIRIIDGTKLIEWILLFPSVEIWLTNRILGIPMAQIETPEQRWSLIRSIGDPPLLTTKVFLSNRDEAVAKVKEVFFGKTPQLKITTHFPDQIVNFVSACLMDLDDESRAETAGRCLIVSGEDAWNMMVNQKEKHILIADSSLDLIGESGMKLLQIAQRAGHAVILGGAAGGIPDPTSIMLPELRSYQLKEVLEKSGFSEERARTLAQKCNGNLGSLLKCLQNLSLIPEWAEGSEATELAVATVLGSWVESSNADRAIVENVSGKSYSEWIEKIREVALRPGTPLNQRDGQWRFIERYEGWHALGIRLFDEHLDRFCNSAITVLGERDSQFELPTNERYMARISGKVLTYSNLLRNGLAESLALLGSFPKALSSCTVGKAEVTAILAVRSILADADWQRWASLNDLLPLLAEAAPGEFLDAIEKSFGSEPNPFDGLFAQEGDAVMGRTYISGLLWSLETLAWDANYLNRVVICLGELAARDPGGRWANRPANSLTSILLPWLPQTCAPLVKRSLAVSTLLTELPDVGWTLLISLLPEFHSTSSMNRRPSWRKTIPDDWSMGVSNKEFFEQNAIYSDMAVNVAKSNRKKLLELIDHIANLPEPSFDKLLDHLESEEVLTMPEADRLEIWVKLVDLVREHRKFSEAKWAMLPAQVDKIASITEKLAPATTTLRYQRLFSENETGLYEEKGDYEHQRSKLENRRQKVVEEIIENGGAAAVFNFAANVKSPWRVGIAHGAVGGKESDCLVLPDLFEPKNNKVDQFAGGFIISRFRIGGWQWVDNIDTTRWTSAQIGQFLSFLPFTSNTWERVKRLLGKDEAEYWNMTSANSYETDSGLEYAIDQLIHYGRPYAALRCINTMLHHKQPLDNKQAVRGLLAALESSENASRIDAYDIIEIIKALQNSPETIPDDLFNVEWAYLPLLDDHLASPKLLDRRLATDPEFFCSAIQLVFHSRNKDRSTEEPTEEKKKFLSNVYRLLSRWRIPPGTREDGTFNGEALNYWLDAVKKKCTESGHFERALDMVGHVLTHVPPDPNGLWIDRSAAAALNAKDAGNMRDGFCLELHNSRGIHFVDSTGQSERKIADRYRAKAEAVENAGFYRFATSLRELATSYDHEAERVVSREQFED